MRLMQGTFAHVFAAVMALTVFTFPSPDDLRAKIGQFVDRQELVLVFPNLKALGLTDTKIAYLGEHAELAERCAAQGLPKAWARDCGSVPAPQPTEPSSTPASPVWLTYAPAEIELVTGQLLCQALWAEAVSSRRQFDVEACIPV